MNFFRLHPISIRVLLQKRAAKKNSTLKKFIWKTRQERLYNVFYILKRDNMLRSCVWMWIFQQFEFSILNEGRSLFLFLEKKADINFYFEKNARVKQTWMLFEPFFCFYDHFTKEFDHKIEIRFILCSWTFISCILPYILSKNKVACFSFILHISIRYKKKSFLFLQRFTKYITSFSFLSQLLSYTQSHTHPFGCTHSLI